MVGPLQKRQENLLHTTMTILYRSAPGCNFPPTKYRTSFINHLQSKRHCACKDVEWTVDQAKSGLDGRGHRMTNTLTSSAENHPPTSILHALTGNDDRPIVEMRTRDGYVNATRMCHGAGKRWPHFHDLDGTKAYLTCLASKTAITVLDLIESNHGGSSPGTWIHPQLAIKLAAWCSPEFEVAVTDLVLRYTKGEVTAEESQTTAAGLAEACEPSRFGLAPSDNVSEVVEKGVYIGRPNGEWTELTTPGQVAVHLPDGAVVLKFGCSDKCPRRVSDHQRDYKGFQLLYWKAADDCRAGENFLREALRMENRLVQGTNSNKGKPDKELVIVRDSEEYQKLKDDVDKCTTLCREDGQQSLKHLELTIKQLEMTETTKQLTETTKQLTETTKQLETQMRQKQLDFDILKYKHEHGLL